MDSSNVGLNNLKKAYQLAKEKEMIKAKRIIRKILKNKKGQKLNYLNSHLKYYYLKLNESLEIEEDQHFEYKIAAALEILKKAVGTMKKILEKESKEV